MKLKEIKGSDINFGAMVEMLVNHFNYSIKEIKSYDELTDEEKKIIDREVFNKVTCNEYEFSDLYTPVTWPDIQYLMTKEGFSENSYLINDDKGIDKFGSSSYMVNAKWLESINR